MTVNEKSNLENTQGGLFNSPPRRESSGLSDGGSRSPNRSPNKSPSSKNSLPDVKKLPSMMMHNMPSIESVSEEDSDEDGKKKDKKDKKAAGDPLKLIDADTP